MADLDKGRLTFHAHLLHADERSCILCVSAAGRRIGPPAQHLQHMTSFGQCWCTEFARTALAARCLLSCRTRLDL